MIKKTISLILAFLCLFATCHAEGPALKELHCTSQLRGILEKIQTLPEGNDLLLKVLDEGPLYIKLNRKFSTQFDGYWSSFERTIYITKNNQSSDCFLITALLFELHNAARDSDLKEMYFLASNGKIGRENFIEAVEYIEYENACSTSILLNQGAESSIFPCDCGWVLSDNFDEHLCVQKAGGHSASLGKMYDDLTSSN